MLTPPSPSPTRDDAGSTSRLGLEPHEVLGDYLFDVVAQHARDADVAVQLARNASDSTLWRGSVSLPSAETWTIWVRTFPGKEPGSTAMTEAARPRSRRHRPSVRRRPAQRRSPLPRLRSSGC